MNKATQLLVALDGVFGVGKKIRSSFQTLLGILTEFGHPFRSKSATDSDLIRPPVPRDFGH
jgi:hypothetical protein